MLRPTNEDKLSADRGDPFDKPMKSNSEPRRPPTKVSTATIPARLKSRGTQRWFFETSLACEFFTVELVSRGYISVRVFDFTSLLKEQPPVTISRNDRLSGTLARKDHDDGNRK